MSSRDEFTEKDWEHGQRFFRAEVRLWTEEFTVWAKNEDEACEKILAMADSEMYIPVLVSSKEERSEALKIYPKEKTHWNDIEDDTVTGWRN